MVKVERERERDTLLCFIHDLKTTLLFSSPTISPFFIFPQLPPSLSPSSSVYCMFLWSNLFITRQGYYIKQFLFHVLFTPFISLCHLIRLVLYYLLIYIYVLLSVRHYHLILLYCLSK